MIFHQLRRKFNYNHKSGLINTLRLILHVPKISQLTLFLKHFLSFLFSLHYSAIASIEWTSSRAHACIGRLHSGPMPAFDGLQAMSKVTLQSFNASVERPCNGPCMHWATSQSSFNAGFHLVKWNSAAWVNDHAHINLKMHLIKSALPQC